MALAVPTRYHPLLPFTWPGAVPPAQPSPNAPMTVISPAYQSQWPPLPMMPPVNAPHGAHTGLQERPRVLVVLPSWYTSVCDAKLLDLARQVFGDPALQRNHLNVQLKCVEQSQLLKAPIVQAPGPVTPPPSSRVSQTTAPHENAGSVLSDQQPPHQWTVGVPTQLQGGIWGLPSSVPTAPFPRVVGQCVPVNTHLPYLPSQLPSFSLVQFPAPVAAPTMSKNQAQPSDPSPAALPQTTTTAFPSASPTSFRIIVANLQSHLSDTQIMDLFKPFHIVLTGMTLYPPDPLGPQGQPVRRAMLGFASKDSARSCRDWLTKKPDGKHIMNAHAVPGGRVVVTPVLNPVRDDPVMVANHPTLAAGPPTRSDARQPSRPSHAIPIVRPTKPDTPQSRDPAPLAPHGFPTPNASPPVARSPENVPSSTPIPPSSASGTSDALVCSTQQPSSPVCPVSLLPPKALDPLDPIPCPNPRPSTSSRPQFPSNKYIVALHGIHPMAAKARVTAALLDPIRDLVGEVLMRRIQAEAGGPRPQYSLYFAFVNKDEADRFLAHVRDAGNVAAVVETGRQLEVETVGIVE